MVWCGVGTPPEALVHPLPTAGLPLRPGEAAHGLLQVSTEVGELTAFLRPVPVLHHSCGCFYYVQQEFLCKHAHCLLSFLCALLKRLLLYNPPMRQLNPTVGFF